VAWAVAVLVVIAVGLVSWFLVEFFSVDGRVGDDGIYMILFYVESIDGYVAHNGHVFDGVWKAKMVADGSDIGDDYLIVKLEVAPRWAKGVGAEDEL